MEAHIGFAFLSIALSYITNQIQKKSESLDDTACYNSYPRVFTPIILVLALLGPIGVLCNFIGLFLVLLILLFNYNQYTKHDNSRFSLFIKKLEGR